MNRPVSAALFATGIGLLSVPAAAVDLGPLRGSYARPALAPVHSWQGAYVAGFAGISQADMRGSEAVGDLIATELRDTDIEREMQVSTWLQPEFDGARGAAYGFLAGYNFQFGETVLGIEADLTLTGLAGEGTDSLGRQRTLDSGVVTGVFVAGTVDAEVDTMATLRARAGYTMGYFLPYVTAGLALAQYSSSRSVDGYIIEDGGPPIPLILGDSKSGVAFGFAAGAGVDVALTENLFLRGEWQYAFFPDMQGVNVSVNTLRGAAGVKF